MQQFIRNPLCWLALCLVGAVYATPPEGIAVRHDWKQTFKKPYFHKEGIPHFEYFGNTLPSLDFIRLSPSLTGMKGAIWADKPNPHKEWIVEFSVNVFGRHLHGGDGIAFWYTKHRGELGPVYGSKDSWEGLMVALDTYDKRDARTNTFVLGMMNHNNFEYTKAEHPMSHILSGCFREYRNLKEPLGVRVMYANRTVTVFVDNINNGDNYQPCFESENIDLPTGYYFGMSAASSHEEADDHDIISFDTYEIRQDAAHSESIPKATKEQLKHMEDIHEKVEKAKHSNDVKLGFDTQDIKMLHDTQFRILNKLDMLIQKSEHSTVNAGSASVHSGTGAHLGSLAEDIRALQDSVHQLTTDIGRFAGSYGITYKMEQLQNAISQLSSKISQIDERSSKQHEETRSSIHYVTTEKSSSLMQYLMFILGGQFVLYVAWNVYQQRTKNERKKYI